MLLVRKDCGMTKCGSILPHLSDRCRLLVRRSCRRITRLVIFNNISHRLVGSLQRQLCLRRQCMDIQDRMQMVLERIWQLNRIRWHSSHIQDKLLDLRFHSGVAIPDRIQRWLNQATAWLLMNGIAARTIPPRSDRWHAASKCHPSHQVCPLDVLIHLEDLRNSTSENRPKRLHESDNEVFLNNHIIGLMPCPS